MRDQEILSERSSILNSFIKQLMDSTITAHVTWSFTTLSNVDVNGRYTIQPPRPGPALSMLLKSYDSLIISLENESHYDAFSDSRLSFDFCIINHQDNAREAAQILATSISLLSRTITNACATFNMEEEWSLGKEYRHDTLGLADIQKLNQMTEDIKLYSQSISSIGDKYVIIINLPGTDESSEPLMKNVPLLSFIILDIIKSEPKAVLDIDRIQFEKNVLFVQVAFNIKKDWVKELSSRSKYIQYEVLSLDDFRKLLIDPTSDYSDFISIKTF